MGIGRWGGSEISHGIHRCRGQPAFDRQCLTRRPSDHRNRFPRRATLDRSRIGGSQADDWCRRSGSEAQHSFSRIPTQPLRGRFFRRIGWERL